MAESAQIAKISPKHENIMRWLLENPEKKLGECATAHGITQAWLSTIIHSSAFVARFREYRDQYNGAALGTLSDKATAMTSLALDRLTEKVEVTESVEDLLAIVQTGVKVLNPVGQTAQGGMQQNNLILVGAGDLAQAREMLRAGAGTGAAPEQVIEAEKVKEG